MLKAMRLLMDALFPTTEHRREREMQRMNEFLSQATDRVHLEMLEQEWFRHYASRR